MENQLFRQINPFRRIVVFVTTPITIYIIVRNLTSCLSKNAATLSFHANWVSRVYPRNIWLNCVCRKVSVARVTVKIIILYCISLVLSRCLPKPPRMSSQLRSRVQLVARTNCTVVLGIAIVHINDVWGRTHAIRVLLDSGSQISAMKDNCLARLGLPIKRFQSSVVGLAQSGCSNSRRYPMSIFATFLF